MVLKLIYKMDVLETLKLHMGYIVGDIFSRVGPSKFFDEMYNLIKHDIGINFDSSHFYLLNYKLIDENNVYFKIDQPFVPRGLLMMIRNLIKHSRMKENIKNSKYLIHFREFRDEVYLEDKENTLRVEAFMQMHQYVSHPIKIRIYLINKLVSIKNKIKNGGSDVIPLKIQLYRIEMILKAIEKNTNLEC